jgi:hypothetical protein
MLWLPSGAETDGQVLTRDSTSSYGIEWATAAAAASPWTYVPAWGPLTHTRTNAGVTKNVPRKYPGGIRVCPCIGFQDNGSAVSDGAWAYQQIRHDQTAANAAAANATVIAAAEDWLVDTGYTYQIFAMSKNDAGVTGQSIALYKNGSLIGESGPAGTDRYGIHRFGLSTGYSFATGDEIEFRAYHTGGTGYIYLDQIYFLPIIKVYDSGFGGQDVDSIVYCAPGALGSYGPTASGVSEASDPYMLDDSVKDTQVIDHLFDADMTFSSYGFSQWGPFPDWINDGRDFERRTPRHQFVIARVGSSTQYAPSTDLGAHVTMCVDSMPVATAAIVSTHPNWYYLGPVSGYIGELQCILWFNSDATGSSIPFLFDRRTGVADVRISVIHQMSSALDD